MFVIRPVRFCAFIGIGVCVGVGVGVGPAADPLSPAKIDSNDIANTVSKIPAIITIITMLNAANWLRRRALRRGGGESA